MKKLKRLLAIIYDLPNAYRVLEIMDNCGCDIEKVSEDYDYWKIKPKWYVTEKEAKDLQTIVLFNMQYRKRNRLWNYIFRSFREGYRPLAKWF